MATLDEKNLGKRLQAARQAAGLTQQELCSRAGLSYSTLTKIERGAIKAPSIFTVQNIASATGVSLSELIGDKLTPAVERPKLKTKNGVSFIYFDVNGSLVHSYQRAFAQIAHDTGNSLDLVESTFWRHNDDVCRGAMSVAELDKILAKTLGVSGIDWQKYYLAAVEPIIEMRELLTETAERYQVGLLSNIMPGFIAAMKKHDILPNINYDTVVDSSEVGVIKPEAKIYKIATERAGCPPYEILLIDDTRANLMAAEKAGWHMQWFDGYRPKESVAHLREALEPAS